MHITYCKNCNNFSYVSKESHYCKECKNPIIKVPVKPEEFFDMPINERYKLAYKLTNNT